MAHPSCTILAFDTSAAHCAAAVVTQDAVLASATEPMSKGQAERILGLCGEMLAAAHLGYPDLTAIAVGVGPGNFTGIRISVSAARGLSLGLGISAIPVSTFDMLRDPLQDTDHAAELVVVEAPRGAAYVQMFAQGRPTAPPELIDPAAPPDHLRRADLCVTGHLAQQVANHLGGRAFPTCIANPAQRLADVARGKFQRGFDRDARPAPLYVRPPDAAPARDQPPPLLP